MSGDTGGGPVKRPRRLEQARVAPGPLRKLKDLLYEAYVAAGAPSLDEITAEIAGDDTLQGAPGRDTIRRCISTPDIPARQAHAVAVAVVLARHAAWDEHDLAARVRELWIQASTAVAPGKPLAEFTDPFALEVHRAIDTGPRQDGTALPVLPAYVERDHDSRLREITREAAGGGSRLVMLVGESSAGKTRACWEAVHTLPDGWRLWHPFDPTRPEAARAELDRIAPRTVVWLNEAQHYLLTPADDLGERVAGGLRSLLSDPDRAPILVLGTIWPEYWATLTTRPGPGAAKDPHASARELLTGHDLPVPPAFTGADLQALAVVARDDPRLAYAAEHTEEGQITQYLAGAPALIERYDNAAPAAKALIQAAMDARRLGHGRNLPLPLLEAAVPGYVTGTQWQRLARHHGWLERALEYVEADCRGALGPLTRLIPYPGEPQPAQPCYRLADYLEQHSRGKSTPRVPAVLWDALVRHATPIDRTALAHVARNHGLLRIAIHLYTTAADAGDRGALLEAVRLLEAAGREEDALAWLQTRADPDALWEGVRLLKGDEDLWYQRDTAADGDDRGALREAVRLLEAAGREEDALAWLQTRADGGDHDALAVAVRLLEAAGREEAALTWLRTRADTGDPYALREAARLLKAAGREQEEISWYRRAAEAGDSFALRRTAWLMKEAGRKEELIAWLRTRADAGDRDALGVVVGLLDEAGRKKEALAWLRTRADSGHRDALGMAARLLEEAGREEEAITWYQRGADAGDSFALWDTVRLLEAAGRREELIAWLRTRADGGDRDALDMAARLLEAAGREGEAITWYQRAADSGDYFDDRVALREAVRLLKKVGGEAEALSWLQTRADGGDRDALDMAARLLEAAGREGEAITWYQRAADSGDFFAVRDAVRLLKAAGRAEEALAWLQSRADGGDFFALGEVVRLLEETDWMPEAAGREEVAAWLQTRADAGDRDALGAAARMLEAAGRAEEALSWLRARVDAGDHDALGEVARMVREAGREEEAITWYQRAAGAGDPFALGKVVELLRAAGREEESERLRRFGWEPDGSIAERWEVVPGEASGGEGRA
ncbi:hypothetical protein ACIPYQ_09100 [Streptomyces sp. NPDC090045]|uniref:tetratricopeptide repeat protein n=1 Tax=Streptomyces sp. NPDC090045 TaxID=3365927 RepID=UPI003823DDE6